MTEKQFKYVNKRDPKTGRPLRDRKTGKVVSARVEMTQAEVDAAEKEHAALQIKAEKA